jgi:hypothetical protein
MGIRKNQIEYASCSEIDVIDAMNKFKSLYEAGFLDINTYNKNMDRLQDQLAEFRLDDDIDPSTPKVGDILYSSWGYSMTIVDFYKVLKVTPSGKSVSVQRLQSKTVEGHAGYEGYVMPTEHEATDRDTFFRNKRVSPSGQGYSITLTSCQTAFTWDGKKKYFNRMD